MVGNSHKPRFSAAYGPEKTLTIGFGCGKVTLFGVRQTMRGQNAGSQSSFQHKGINMKPVNHLNRVRRLLLKTSGGKPYINGGRKMNNYDQLNAWVTRVKDNILALSAGKAKNLLRLLVILLLLAGISFGEISTGISLALKSDSSSGKTVFSLLLIISKR